MTRQSRIILNAFVEVLILSVLIVAVPLVIALDLLVLNNAIGEISLTEITQSLLLAVSVGVFAFTARQDVRRRGFMVLCAGFLACMFIREQDGFLDLIFRGFWFWPAILTALGSIVYAWRRGRETLAAMAEFIETKAAHYMIFGLLSLLVFSRTFGGGKMLWSHVMGQDYNRLFKAALQEGLELFGYIFITYASCLVPRSFNKAPSPTHYEAASTQKETPATRRGS